MLRESLDLPAKRDADAQAMADCCEDALIQQRAGEGGFGFYTSVLVFMHRDAKTLKQTVDAVRAHCQQMGLVLRCESMNGVEAYLGSLPGHGDYNLRKVLVDTHFVSHALPTSGVYQGESQAPCPMAGYDKGPPLALCATQGGKTVLFKFACQ